MATEFSLELCLLLFIFFSCKISVFSQSTAAVPPVPRRSSPFYLSHQHSHPKFTDFLLVVMSSAVSSELCIQANYMLAVKRKMMFAASTLYLGVPSSYSYLCTLQLNHVVPCPELLTVSTIRCCGISLQQGAGRVQTASLYQHQ